MILLLDTHVFLWWDSGHRSLGAEARASIEAADNRVLISAASLWEIAIKHRLGKLAFSGSATAAIGANGFEELAVLSIDAEHAGELPWRHADPFDRLLVAQAVRLGASLVTADAAVRNYGRIPLLWARQAGAPLPAKKVSAPAQVSPAADPARSVPADGRGARP